MAAANNTSLAQYPKPPRLPLSSFWTQMYPPKPAFTAQSVPDLSDRIYIVTGSNTGVGKEVAQILYSKNATVYIAARSEQRARRAIDEIDRYAPHSHGRLEFLRIDFNDLATIKPAVEAFTSQETKLHVLFNNAAVQDLRNDAAAEKTAQGFEKHFGVNVLGPFLFTQLLIPTLTATASSSPDAAAVRVVWVCSLGTEVTGEKSRGISPDYLDYYPRLSPLERYGVSKAGSWLHAVEMARRHPTIMSVPCNPGHLRSELYRDAGRILRGLLNAVVLYPSVYGAYTELFCALSREVTAARNGEWVVPWGRFHGIRADLRAAARCREEGGNGHAREFWEWCEEQVGPFA